MDLSPATDTVIEDEEAAEAADEPAASKARAEADGEEPSEDPEANSEDPEAEATEEAEASEEPEGRLGPGQALSDEELEQELLALLFASAETLSLQRLVQLLRRPARARVKAALETLTARLESEPLPVVLRPISGGWRLLTDPSQGDAVARLRKEPKPERISGAALETLAIVAYRQPVTKAEIEAIRGVQSGQMLRSLVDRRLVRVAGRAETPGAPLQYATSKEFLDRFGLADLKALPRDGELVQGS